MDISWKLISLSLGLLLFQLCNGFPINLENTSADSHSQLLTGLVAVLLTVCSVVFLVGCLCCHRKNGFKEFRDSPVVASTSSNLDHGHVNPISNGEFTIFTPLSPPHQNNNVFLANQQIITRTPDDYTYGDVDVSNWFGPGEKEFPRNKLKYIKELGRGWFGKVVEGAAQEIGNNHQQWTPVVVRILEASASSRERVIFLHDASIYRCGTHPNLLKLIGRCLDTIPLLLLQEYCPQGDLKNYLRLNKLNSENSVLSTEYPLIWSCQLTSALKFLHEKNVTHPDLASRNCQLTSNLTLKLGDYGLAVQRYPQDYYQGSEGVAVRWCAPESLICTSTTIQPKKITKEANVWSLGVTIWEICECGEQPYVTLTDDEVVSQVLGSPNFRLTRPTFTVLYTDYIYRLMELCWTNAESRPSVAQIDLMLSDLLLVHKNTNASSNSAAAVEPSDFDKRWESLKPNHIVKTDNHITSSIGTLEGDFVIEITKPLSPSLNNLHGSLDNLAGNRGKLLEFKLGPAPPSLDQSTLSDSLNGSLPHRSSESETEDENWKKKIELGAYTEKVRQKSKSVADLMVLTHIDYSESESETPLPSLDYRINYKNVRYPPKSNLENVSLTFGSEGNLLSVHDTFQDELKKLQEERRDSLLFVPDNHSQNTVSFNENEPFVDLLKVSNINDESPSKRLMQELNSGADIKPANQVYNVFKVTIDKYSPLHVNSVKLQEIINLEDYDETISVDGPKLAEENISETIKPKKQEVEKVFMHSLPNHTTEEKPEKIVDSHKIDFVVEDKPPLNNAEPKTQRIENVAVDFLPNDATVEENSPLHNKKTDSIKTSYTVPTLVQLIESRDELMDYIITNYDHDSLDDSFEKEIDEGPVKSTSIKFNSENLYQSDSIESIKLSDRGEKKMDVNVAFIKEENQTEETKKVEFDLDQEATLPNSLTQSSVFTSTPFRKKSLQEVEETYPSLNIYNENVEDPEKIEEDLQFSSNFTPLDENERNLNYSLETWDNFLGKTMDTQDHEEEMFNSLISAPKNFIECDEVLDCNPPDLIKDLGASERQYTPDNTPENETYVLENPSDEVDDASEDNTFIINRLDDDDDDDEKDEGGTWESGGGWFLHPRSNDEDVSGEMETNTKHKDSYVGFNMDDEIMAAIRNELLTKLPHAQGTASENVKEDEEWETEERSEVFLKYNVYHAPLSPIPEEDSLFESCSGDTTPRQNSECDSYSSEYEDQEEEVMPQDTETVSVHRSESTHTNLHRQTPSQESCCSNDTLFNLEELVCITDQEYNKNAVEDSFNKRENEIVEIKTPEIVSNKCIEDFLQSERESSSVTLIKVESCEDESSSETPSTSTDPLLLYNKKSFVPPLPSPEDKPWKQLPASQLTYDKVNYTNVREINEPSANIYENDEIGQNEKQEVYEYVDKFKKIDTNTRGDEIYDDVDTDTLYDNVDTNTRSDELYDSVDNVENINPNKTKAADQEVYENVPSAKKSEINPEYKNGDDLNVVYENIENVRDFYNEADYATLVNLENTKNSADFNTKLTPDECEDTDELIISQDDDDLFGVLTDIRFSGPTDSQFMSTSFSESNDNDEQDWDSGSDTRSSSSGEFIWKLDDIKPLEGIEEEAYSEGSVSSGCTSSDEGENPEFVPSAWDKFATPTKSALRSPEKTLEKEEKKTRGVWFKKQKYHCVYEYPREPESPVLQSQDLWKPQSDFTSFGDWDFDADTYLPPPTGDTDILNLNNYQPPNYNKGRNLYELVDISEPTGNSAGNDDEFFISGSARPFDMISSLSSQFFPGSNSHWAPENMTPDSGVEDITPGSLIDDYPSVASRKFNAVPSLKTLAAEVSNKSKRQNVNNVLGGLRHTRNKLKLDLPPSPSAFTINKTFTVESDIEPVVLREKPTFTTFGKSRFLVQQVDTPDGAMDNKNVSFEALPYKPLKTFEVEEKNKENLNEPLTTIKSQIIKEDFESDKLKTKIEKVKGEASLLDSADEDSGIESSTLERKLNNVL
ncbi:unnamed protein product [Brassicogethes aeneus]|uniref:Protein kinase domain-containing protein n=1 Tax=Brassicogethes aeneus TaxID=1431903 RepID=A0A9P0F918_BRAAE|nr:unnamed protein product [Brassicogethes aeneus]